MAWQEHTGNMVNLMLENAASLNKRFQPNGTFVSTWWRVIKRILWCSGFLGSPCFVLLAKIRFKI